jgi:hypothetical protein
LADYLYLWETAMEKQAFEMAMTFVSLRGDSSSYMRQQDSVFAAQDVTSGVVSLLFTLGFWALGGVYGLVTLL